MKKRFKTKFIFILFSFLFGLLIRPYLNPYVRQILINTNKTFNILISKENCIPKSINTIQNGSILIIGHAYGSYNSSIGVNNNNISKKIINLYESNKEKIDMIIFSGDVLSEPSIKRWNNFYEIFEEDLDIHIAPGNHDVGFISSISARRDIFEFIQLKQGLKYSYPYHLIIKDNLLIIDDSNKKNIEFSKIDNLIEKYGYKKNIYIIRHHVIPNSLRWSSNSKGNHGYLNGKEIIENFSYKDKITFIYGDGGASTQLPRIDCRVIANTHHIVNGIGDIDGDLILVLKDNVLYKMRI